MRTPKSNWQRIRALTMAAALAAAVTTALAQPKAVQRPWATARFNLVDVKLFQALAALRDFAGVCVRQDAGLTGQLSLVSPGEVTATQAIHLLLQRLPSRGWRAEIDVTGCLWIRAATPDELLAQPRQQTYALDPRESKHWAESLRPLLSAHGNMELLVDGQLVVIDIPDVHTQIARRLLVLRSDGPIQLKASIRLENAP